MRILDRYILTEALRPFLVALLAFIVMLTGHMLFRVVEVIVEHGVPLPSVLRFVALQIPYATVMALPVSVLLACSLGVNRLASDNEFAAIRAGGAGYARTMLPLWLVGLLACMASLALNERAVPWSRAQAEQLVRDMVLRRQSLAFQPGKFTDTGQGIHLYVGGTDPRRGELHDLLVFYVQPADYPILFTAGRGVFHGDMLSPLDAHVFFVNGQGQTTDMRPGSLEIDLRQVAHAATSAPGSTGIAEMPLGELMRQRNELQRQSPGAARSHTVELHSRLALVASCLVFAVLAGPVTLRFARGQSLVGILATMIIVFGYYLAMIWTRTLGETGVLPPAVAAWAQNALLLIAALVAIRRLR
jgi:LPS export ABC transporter permease LptF